MDTVTLENKQIKGITLRNLIIIIGAVFAFAGGFFKINHSQEQLNNALIKVQNDLQEIKLDKKEATNKMQTDYNLLKDRFYSMEIRMVRFEMILKDKDLMPVNE